MTITGQDAESGVIVLDVPWLPNFALFDTFIPKTVAE